jgi:hypothetical protein
VFGGTQRNRFGVNSMKINPPISVCLLLAAALTASAWLNQAELAKVNKPPCVQKIGTPFCVDAPDKFYAGNKVRPPRPWEIKGLSIEEKMRIWQRRDGDIAAMPKSFVLKKGDLFLARVFRDGDYINAVNGKNTSEKSKAEIEEEIGEQLSYQILQKINLKGYFGIIETWKKDGSRSSINVNDGRNIFITLRYMLNSHKQPYRLVFTARQGRILYQKVIERMEGTERPECTLDLPTLREGYIRRSACSRWADEDDIIKEFISYIRIVKS